MWTIEQAFIEIDSLRKKIADTIGSTADFIKKTAIKNNLTTTAAGNVLDARQGKALNDKIENICAPNTMENQVLRGAALITGSGKILRFSASPNRTIKNLENVHNINVAVNNLVLYYNGQQYTIDVTKITAGAQWYNFGFSFQLDHETGYIADTNNVSVGFSLGFNMTYEN